MFSRQRFVKILLDQSNLDPYQSGFRWCRAQSDTHNTTSLLYKLARPSLRNSHLTTHTLQKRANYGESPTSTFKERSTRYLSCFDVGPLFLEGLERCRATNPNINAYLLEMREWDFWLASSSRGIVVTQLMNSASANGYLTQWNSRISNSDLCSPEIRAPLHKLPRNRQQWQID